MNQLHEIASENVPGVLKLNFINVFAQLSLIEKKQIKHWDINSVCWIMIRLRYILSETSILCYGWALLYFLVHKYVCKTRIISQRVFQRKYTIIHILIHA